MVGEGCVCECLKAGVCSVPREEGLQAWVSSLGKDAHTFSTIKIELLDRMGLYEQGQ